MILRGRIIDATESSDCYITGSSSPNQSYKHSLPTEEIGNRMFPFKVATDNYAWSMQMNTATKSGRAHFDERMFSPEYSARFYDKNSIQEQ